MAEEATAVPETMEEPRSPEVEREPTPRTRYEKIAKSVQDKQVHRQAREASLPDYVTKFTKLSPEEVAAEKAAGTPLVDFGSGISLRMDRFPIIPKAGETNGDYAVPVAVSLLLTIAAEGAALFMVIFILAITAINDNVKRASFRALCRRASTTPEGYAVLTNLGNWSDADRTAVQAQLGGEPPEACGWTNIAIRHFATDSLETEYQPPGGFVNLRTALGGCQEYRDCNTSVLASCATAILPQGPWDEKNDLFGIEGNALLIDTPSSRYCMGGWPSDGASITSALFSLIIILLLLLFLVRIRYLSQSMARLEDESRITTADYAVQIEGLDRTIPPGELRRRLLAEIEGLSFSGEPNFFKGKVHHLEVGRFCRKEIKVMEETCKMDVAVEELYERYKYKKSIGESTAGEEAGLAKLGPKYTETRAEMKRLQAEADTSTGHAFVVFNEELDRNRFYVLFNPKVNQQKKPEFGSVEDAGKLANSSAPVLEVASERAKEAAKEAAANPNPEPEPLKEIANYALGLEKVDDLLVVKSAPEPREVNWGALELSDEHERTVFLQGMSLLTVVLILGAGALVLAKVGQFVFKKNSVDMVWYEKQTYGILITLGVTAVTMVFNTTIRKLTDIYVAWEGQDTHTQAEASMFIKLSLGLCTNTVLVPLLIALFLSNGSIDQTWCVTHLSSYRFSLSRPPFSPPRGLPVSGTSPAVSSRR